MNSRCVGTVGLGLVDDDLNAAVIATFAESAGRSLEIIVTVGADTDESSDSIVDVSPGGVVKSTRLDVKRYIAGTFGVDLG